MKTKTTANIDTRKEAGAEQVTTNVTFNWDGISTDELQQMAQQALIVKLQAKWRKDGIPAGAHAVNVSDYRPGVRAERTVNVDNIVAKLTPEQRAALIAKLTSM